MRNPGTILFFGSAPTVGDAGIGLSALQALRELFPDAPIRIATGTPEDYEAFELPGPVTIGPKPILRPSGGLVGTVRGWWRGSRIESRGTQALPPDLRAAFEGVGLVVFQGGPQGNDVFLPLHKLEELRLRFVAARSLGAPVVLWGQGFGPFAWPGARGRRMRRLAGRVFGAADLIATRDAASAPALRRIGVPAGVVLEAADAAVRMRVGDTAEREADRCLAAAGVEPGERLLGVCLRDLRGRYGFDDATHAAFVTRVAEAVDRVADQTDRVLFCSTDCREGREVDSDLSVMRAVVAKMRSGHRATVVDRPPGPAALAALYGRCRVLLAGRLHPAIFAAGRGTPSVLLSYTGKCDDFMGRLGSGGAALPAREAEAAAIASELERLLERPAEAMEQLEAGMATMRAEAGRTIEAVRNLMEGSR